jgi:O-antigen/teichoic acid export membrane protein
VRLKRVKFWFFLAFKFLAGQGAIQAINLLTGLILLRVLSIEEYALYTLANVMLALASLGSNLGLTSAFITFGSQAKDDRSKLGSLFFTIQKYRRQLFFVVTLLIIALAPLLTRGRGWSWANVALCITLVIMSNWVQLSLTLRTGVFDIYHDADSQWWVGLTSAAVRLLLTVTLCIFFPSAWLILTVNFIALAMSDWVASRRCGTYLDHGESPSQEQCEAIKRFVYPLAPSVVYYAVASQITLLLLGLFGHTSSVAQVSALANYGRIISMLGLLNGFIIQPYFARISIKGEFVRKCSFVVGGYVLFASMVFATALIVPSWWLLLLGEKYVDLKAEIPLAVAIPLLVLFADSLYTLLASRAWTGGQYLTIGVSLIIQVIFIPLVGVDNTRHALLLAVTLALGNVAVQLTLLIRRLLGSSQWLIMPPLTQEQV